MRLAIAAIVVIVLGLATPGAAQDNQFTPDLEIGIPMLAGGMLVPVEATGVSLEVPWTYTFPAAAAQPSGSTTIVWTLTCPNVTSDPVSATVTFAPGQQEYTGTAVIPLSAPRDAPGLQIERCAVAGEAGGAVDSLQASATKETDMAIAFYANITVSAPDSSRQGGPQKQVPYSIQVTNNGNTRIVVTFEVADGPGGQWNLLLPEVMLLDSPNSGAGQTTNTAIVTVATPFDNGYNSGSADFVIRVHTAAADDPDQVGPSTDVPFTAQVKGFYVPGPQLPLLLAVLGIAAVLRVRRL